MKQQTLILEVRVPLENRKNFEWRSATASEEIIRSASYMIDLSIDWSFFHFTKIETCPKHLLANS